jgi:TPR repeat protein
LQYGFGTSKDPAKAIELYEKSVAMGDITSTINLGSIYLDDIKNPGKAAEWFRKGAEAGDAAAMANLGYCYENGLGVTKDDVIASQWYLKSANAGSALGMYNIGLNLAYGRGIAANYDAGIAWIKRSAAAGYQPATKQLVALPQEMRARQLNAVLGFLGSAMRSGSGSGTSYDGFGLPPDDDYHRNINDHIRRNQELEYERTIHGGGAPGTPKSAADF